MMPVSTLARESRSLHLEKFWPHDLILWVLPLILVVQVTIWSVFLPKGGLRGIVDFRQLYTGGYMVRTGHRKELCNYDAQKRFEDALVPIDIDFMMPINHLPFEELLFVPLSRFSYRTAYWVFLAFNGTLLAVCIRLLRSSMRVLSNRWRWFPALLFAAFYPISRAAVQGQDSIILLTLLAGALWSLDQGNEMTAGLLAGMGVFKFQIVIPIALLFLMWRRWRFCAGVAVSSAAAALISVWLVGLQGAGEYADTLLGMSVRLSSRADMLHYGTVPTSMFNLRGLATAILGGTLSRFSLLFVVFVCSIAVLVIAARQRVSLPLAIMAGALVSYHFLCHDASILIIPLSAALCSRSVWNGAAAALLLIIPIAAVIPQYGYVAAIPLLALFVLSVSSADLRVSLAGVSTHARN
jgi:hypothetical protein